MEYEINLEALVKMKRVFEEADEDGSGELDPDEFSEKLGPHLGAHLSREQIAQLFLKIDADCGGTIDWDEFTDYFFLKRGVTNVAEDAQAALFPKATWRTEWRGQEHGEPVQRLAACEPLEKYVSCGRDGTVRLWHMRDLAPVQTVRSSGAWVNDAVYLPGQRKLLVAAMDRTLSYYDVVCHSFELSGRLQAIGQMGSPTCLAVLEGDTPAPSIFYGDTTGAVVRLRCDPPAPHSAVPRPLAPRDYEVLHQAHTDWVTQLLDIPDVGLLSSSLDSTVKILDLGRGAVANTFALHRKPVCSMAYSRAFSLVASAGPERAVLLWPPKGNINRRVGELAGHSAGVVQVVIADAKSQAITLSEDHVVRVWDLRNHGLIQTLSSEEWERQEDARPEALFYDAQREQLLTAAARPTMWEHRAVRSTHGHRGRLCAALYNSAFHVVVSGDQSGNILMWNAQTGSCEGGFAFNAAASGGGGGSSMAGARAAGGAEGGVKLTAMGFDANQRRLLTASEAGDLKMWNFNSGAVLREYRHKEGRKEITAVAFLAPASSGDGDDDSATEEGGESEDDEAPGSGGGRSDSGEEDEGEDEGPPSLVLATGWSRGLCVWEDADENEVCDYRRLAPRHAADVLCMAALPGDEPLVATGDFEGGIRVWHLPSGACIADLAYGGAQWERAVCKLAWQPGAGGSSCPVLLAAGQDGCVKAWQLALSPTEPAAAEGQHEAGAADSAGSRRQQQGEGEDSTCAAPAATACTASLVEEIRVTTRARDCVTALALDSDSQRLVTGDTSGIVRVWALGSRGDSGSSSYGSSGSGGGALLQPLARWRARRGAVVSVQHIPRHDLLLLGSADGSVSVWTLQGGLVGVFGQHCWDLGDRATWQEPSGAAPAAAQRSPAAGTAAGLTPREILARTPRRTAWEAEVAVPSPRGQRQPQAAEGRLPARALSAAARTLDNSPRASPQRALTSALPATAAAIADGASDAKQQLQKLALALPPIPDSAAEAAAASPEGLEQPPPQQQQGQQPGSHPPQQVPAGGGQAAPSSELLSPEAGRLLAEAVAASRAARDAWQLPLSLQAHGALALNDLASVPADASEIWGSIKGYHGTGRRNAPKARAERAGNGREQRAELAAIMQKTAPAFGRSAASQCLSLLQEPRQPS